MKGGVALRRKLRKNNCYICLTGERIEIVRREYCVDEDSCIIEQKDNGTWLWQLVKLKRTWWGSYRLKKDWFLQWWDFPQNYRAI